MPGIAGLITRMPRERAEQELFQMIEAQCHEDFYVAGTWVEESLGVYVGWTARKDSFCDGMPLKNERGDVVLVFSGEEYPEAGLAERLRGQGHDVRHGGASYLVHVAEEAPSFPTGLNGRFHGLLADLRRGTATLFNDRYAIHRLYYHESKGAFYFAAEAKAILAVRPELRKLDSQSLGEFIACGCTLENRSLFHGTQTLPGGSKWLFRGGSLTKKELYFEPREWENQETLGPEQYYRELRDVFSRNVPRYFSGDEPVAMSLTGGLDSRMILAWQRPAPCTLPCYTFGGALRDCGDVVIARQVAQMCGQSHTVIPTGKEFFSKFPEYAERAVYVTDACVDTSRSIDVYWNQRARQIAPVRMTGNYGGELLRGVRTFKPVEPTPGLFHKDFHPYFRQAAETYASNVVGHPVSFAVFKQAPWNHFGMLALEQTQLSLRTPFYDNDLVRTVFRAPEAFLTADEPSIRLIADGSKKLLRIPTDRGLLGERGRVSRAAHHLLLEFLFKAEYAYDMGMPQSAARIDHLFRGLRLERLFLGTHKVSHFRTWYRDFFASYVREVLLDQRSVARPYIERKGLELVIRGHLKGNRNYTNEIHKLLTLELTHRLFIDSRPSTPFPKALRDQSLAEPVSKFLGSEA